MILSALARGGLGLVSTKDDLGNGRFLSFRFFFLTADASVTFDQLLLSFRGCVHLGQVEVSLPVFACPIFTGLGTGPKRCHQPLYADWELILAAEFAQTPCRVARWSG